MKTLKSITAVAFIIIIALMFNHSCIISNVNSISGNGNVIQKNYEINQFSQIDLRGTFNVVLVKGEKENLVIETDENLYEYIIVENKNDNLQVYSDRNVVLRPTKLRVEITYNTLEKISFAGACNITSDATIESEYFAIDISGAVSGGLNINSIELITTISGAGDLTLTGNAVFHKAVLSGASSLKASDLITGKTDISLSGAGAAHVYTSEELKANLSGVGSIKYSGNPKTKQTNVSGIGQIRSAE